MPDPRPPGSLPKKNVNLFTVPAPKVVPPKRTDGAFNVPPAKPTQGKPPAPDLPSRLPLHTSPSGRFSFGLRLGFDEPPLPKDLKLSLERAELLDQRLMGMPPSGWEQTDKADLAKAIWGIFSENIAPDLAKKLTSGLQTKSAPGRSYELDLVLITDFSEDVGGGVQFTVRW